MQKSYTNKIVLVTRGTSGIGRATALAFVEAGPKVVITSRREKEGTNVAGEITKTGGKISRRNHPRRRFVSHGCRNGSSSGLRNRAPGAQARRSRSGLYAAPTHKAAVPDNNRFCVKVQSFLSFTEAAGAPIAICTCGAFNGHCRSFSNLRRKS